MSYNNKNNNKKQLEFLNNFITLYGINGLHDTDTEIHSSNLVKIDDMTKNIPEIKKLFKTSVMNLSRNNYQITKTNAVSILKHLCLQANVPFKINKYPNYYTFALSPQNVLLKEYRNGNILPFDKKDKTHEQDIKPITSLNKLNKISCLHISDSYCGSVQSDKKECFEAGNDIKDDISDFLVKQDLTQKGIFELVKNEKYQSVLLTGVFFQKIKQWWKVGEENFVLFSLPSYVDVYRNILKLTTYDKKGNMISIYNPGTMPGSQYYAGPTYSLGMCKLKNHNIIQFTAIRYYNDVNLYIPYTGFTPHYFKVEIECQFIQTKLRSLNYEQFNYINEMKYIQEYTVNSMGEVSLPRSNCFMFKNVDNAILKVNGVMELGIVKNKEYPMPTFTEFVIYPKDPAKSLSVTVLDIDKKLDEGETIYWDLNGDKYIVKDGLIGKMT